MEKSVNERDLGLPQGRHCYEGDWSKMKDPPSKWRSIGSYGIDFIRPALVASKLSICSLSRRSKVQFPV